MHMKRLVITAAALLGLTLLPGSSHAWHHGVQYVRVPIMPVGTAPVGGFGLGVPAGGFSFGVPAGGFSFGVPAAGFGVPAAGFGFGVPAGGFSFGVPAGGFSFGVPAGGYSFGVPSGFGASGFGTSADAQGVLDQILLPLLLQRLGGAISGGGSGGGGARVTMSDADIKKLADAITSQGGIKDLQGKVADIDKILRALIKQKFPDVKVPDAVPPIGMNAPQSSPVVEGLRADFRALAAEIEARQAGPKTTPVAAPRESEKLRKEFQAIVAEIEAAQAAQARTESATTNRVVVGGR
jgi:hypothetical protein